MYWSAEDLLQIRLKIKRGTGRSVGFGGSSFLNLRERDGVGWYGKDKQGRHARIERVGFYGIA